MAKTTSEKKKNPQLVIFNGSQNESFKWEIYSV